MKIYLSGPMTGIPDLNRPEFNRVAALLRKRGHHVFNPAEQEPQEPNEYRKALSLGLQWICEEAEWFVSLKGSDDSPGARAEIRAALACGIPRWMQSIEEVVVTERFRPMGHNTQELEMPDDE